MDYEKVEKILKTDVWRVSESTQEERKIFSDKRGGGFFTFVLKSGQKFASHFSEEGSGIRTKKRRLTFRPIPIDNKLEGLKEFSWIVPVYIVGEFLSGGSEEEYEFDKDLSNKDKEIYMEILDSRPFDPMSNTDGPIPLFFQADKVAKTYFEFKNSLISKGKTVPTTIRTQKLTQSR